jgi:leucyl aminopeptidase
MEVKVVSGDITELPVSAIVVNLFEGVKKPSGATAAVDKALGGLITQLIDEGEIKGKRNHVTIIHSMGRIAPQRVVIAGLGKEKELTLSVIRGVAAESCRSLRKVGARHVATISHGADVKGIAVDKSAQAVTEGAMLGLYTFLKHQTREAEEGEIEQLLIVEREEKKLALLKRGSARGRIMAEATSLARDMANEPANYMTPTHMAEVAQSVASEWGLECRILEQADIEKLGMGAFLGVSKGSRQPPKLIVLSYKGGDPQRSTLGLVGKGITFDSGGISIKPSEGMGDMKGDMAGGAAVIAAMRAIGELRPQVSITAIVPATENLPDGAALKPGDIIRALNGKTIEVVNTDAEGRLILADALSYALKLGLSPVVDVATLTGACHIALGDLCTGAFGNNQDLMDKLLKAGEEAGEYIWQMPMYEEYKEQNKSDVADIKNSGGRWGGAITAAQFLAEFVEQTPWVHLDIAGPSRAEKERNHLVKGASGVAVRTLVNLALAHES